MSDFSQLSQFVNKETTFSAAVVSSVLINGNRTSIEVEVKLLPENRPVPATIVMPFNSSGGRINFPPSVNDLVFGAYENTTNMYYVLGYISDNKTPLADIVSSGGMQIDANRINLGSAPTEPFVLGNILKTLLIDISQTVSYILQLMISGNFLVTTAPGVATAPNASYSAALNAKKTLTDNDKTNLLDTPSTNILSQKIFGERPDA